MSEHVHYMPSWLPWDGGTLGTKTHVWIKRGHEHDLPHERVHFRQATELGSARFLWRWLTSSKQRIALEAEAYAQDVVLGVNSLDNCARRLSSDVYGSVVTFDEAKAAIEKWLPDA